MKSIARVGRLATFAAGAMLVVAPTLRAQALPPAAELVAKHVAAIGGKDALAKVTSMEQKGTMEIPTMGLNATVEGVMAAPHKMVSKQTIPGIGEIAGGYDGTTGWSMNPMQGPRVLSGAELEQAKEQADFVGNMTYAMDRYSSAETMGLVDYANEKAYKVKFVRKGSGRETITYFSQASGLAIGGEMTQDSEMGKMQLTSVSSEYKDFGGIKMATRTEVTMGPTKIITVIQDVKFNAAPATAFELPAQVKALVKN